MKPIKQILIDRLEEKGIDCDNIPGFMRILANSFFADPLMTLDQIKKRLNYLGWDGFDLDDHTLQLAIACLEAEGMKELQVKSARWFEHNFKPAVKPIEGQTSEKKLAATG
ncbi:MAG: hypothetical protein JSU83_23120 [Deltaproteobacteria bacterium]|nr:MAG: hypothetical protein JSU83_23120 [Deltaproteobacteria bacterium]